MRPALVFHLFVTGSLVLCTPALAQPVPSREPGSTHIFPAGGRRGTVVKVRVGAECIPPETRLRIWGEGVTAPRVLGPKVQGRYEPSPRREPILIPISYPKEWQSKIEIAADAPLGSKFWRLTCARGGTGARPFIVGDLPEFTETESNSVPARAERITLPVTINGQIAGERDLDYYVFSAEAGQVVSCDVVAGRLGSPLDPVLEVRDAQGRRVALQEIRVGSDTIAAFRVPQTGDYVLLVANVGFHGGPQYVYRMTVTTAPYAPYAFPPSGQVGQSAEIRLYALTGVPEGARRPSLRVLKETVTFNPKHSPLTTDRSPDRRGEFWFRSSVAPAAPIQLVAGDFPETVEAEDNGSPASATVLNPPVTVNGQFLSAADDDWYTFSADEGQAFTITCQPFPSGGSTLPVLELSDAQGKVLSKANSAESPDRRIHIQWQAPADGNYRILLQDLQHGVRGGPEFIYRLSLRPSQPDFSLSLSSDFANVLQDGKTELEVRVQRDGGFNGPVDLVVEGLPEGVRAEKTRIAQNHNSGKLVLVAEKEARSTGATLRIFGRAMLAGQKRKRLALAPHLGHDAEGVSFGPSVVDHVHLTVQHKPVFRLFCSEAYQYARRGTVHRYLMQVERLGDFKGPIVLQPGDRQNRDLDGVQIRETVAAPEVTEIEVPIYLPETMHINVVSLTQLYTQGYAFFEDKFGQRQSTLVVSEKRNLIRPLPAVVKLKALEREVVAGPGSTITCDLQLERTTNFTGPMVVQLFEPTSEFGVSADPVRIKAGQTHARVPVRFRQRVTGKPGVSLRFRAVGELPGQITVITEASIPVRWQ